MFISKLTFIIRVKEHSSEQSEKAIGTGIDSKGRKTTLPTTAAAVGVTSIESQKTATNNLSDLIDHTLTLHTTHKIQIVKILTFEINVPKEGSQWSRYRKSIAENKLKNNHKNINNEKNKANEGVKSESSKSVECAQTRERTWGISTINFIATVDQYGKISDDLEFHDSQQLHS